MTKCAWFWIAIEKEVKHLTFKWSCLHVCYEACLLLKDCNAKMLLKTSKAKSNETIVNSSSLMRMTQISCIHDYPRDHSVQVLSSEFKTMVTETLTQSLCKQASNNDSKGNYKISKSSTHVHQITQVTCLMQLYQK